MLWPLSSNSVSNTLAIQQAALAFQRLVTKGKKIGTQMGFKFVYDLYQNGEFAKVIVTNKESSRVGLDNEILM